MRTIITRIVQVLETISGIALLLMLGVILLQVVLRYGFEDGLIWGEEFARIMMIAAALFGAAVAHHRGKHIRFDLLEHMLARPARHAMALLSELVVLCTASVITYFGWQLAAENETQESLTLGISMIVIYAIVPIGFGWMSLASLRRLLVLVFNPDLDANTSGEQA